MAVAELSLPGLGNSRSAVRPDGGAAKRVRRVREVGPAPVAHGRRAAGRAPARGSGVLAWSLGLAEATASSEAKSSVSPLVTTLCWQAEDFVIVQDCAPCTIFQAKTMPECSMTGFIEQISCAVSKKEEYKSCRSVVTEAHSFWKFEGAMICVAVVFALLVMCRQRVLDRKALEKVRKQIESI
ncbi:protein JTB [Chelonoidis abingdonii]|uniref:protein JTB n=1 Tax=Chelonoidis abingdonii TaxID=106734 RepID=UPI0013F1C222|nr:protein JTB [Chelonoidis abingdonii]